MATPLIVDGRNLLDPAPVRAAGFAYESVGRPGDPADVLRPPDRAEPSRDRRRPRGRRGHAPAPPHRHDAQADAADRRPAVPRAPASSSCAAPASSGSCSPAATCPTRSSAYFGEGDGRARQYAVEPRAARHRRRDPLRRARGGVDRDVPGAQRRRAGRRRPRPRSSRPPRRAARGDDRAAPRSTTRAATASCDRRRRRACTAFLEKPAAGEIDADARSTPARTSLEPDVLDLIPPGRSVSIEREVFPRSSARALRAAPTRATGATSARPRATSPRTSTGCPPEASSTPRPRRSDRHPSSARSSARAAGSGPARGCAVRSSSPERLWRRA